MGKTYVDTVKYLVYADLEIGGLVEKPDVVGAIFGQTEGLLGDELDLRELQKNGRIGRIEVDLQPRGGKSIGKINLPSSLDMIETSVLAAALESVDRVGPCEAKIKILKIEDTRNVKRKAVIDRAKDLLRTMLKDEIPDSKEISEMVRQEVKIAEISEYGPEKLPSGPNVDRFDSLIIVEGRADVLNLLKNDVNNVVAVGGANVPKTIAKLCREKEVTVFLDGDRGGDIILRELSEVADIDFVARAPTGKEVEELTRKEMIKCLRARVPYDEIAGNTRKEGDRRGGREERPVHLARHPAGRSGRPDESRSSNASSQLDIPSIGDDQQAGAQAVEQQAAPSAVSSDSAPVSSGDGNGYLKSLAELENTLKARLYDKQGTVLNEIPVRDLIKSISDMQDIGAVVFDGIITQRLVDLAEKKGIATLVGVKTGNVFRRPGSIQIVTKA
ncbi:DNA primase DnaG [Candidatus Gugararchaeum adminiculabundum]|nr:DNA primase DnaG [Candidatus Gugararchaeum adminiculabundum]